ncbi:MAG: hypothetical protein KC425_26155, partial [Anaerolineales bacterium]|nr:hypothetical protein [Anaerolineales bacterium]
SSWEIWINRQGREPQGIVRAADYPAVLDELAAALLAWQDEAGRPRVQAVQRAGEAYHGRFQHLAPDLTITWNPAAAPDAAALPGNASRFSGDHQPEGIFVAVGPDVQAQGELHGVQLQDVAPTLLRLAGLPVPGGLDGRALLPAG